MARCPDDGVHVIEIFFERHAPGCSQPVYGPRRTTCKRLLTRHVSRVFELARMDAEIAIRGVQCGFQVSERKVARRRQGADNAEAHAVVEQPIKRGRDPNGWYDARPARRALRLNLCIDLSRRT